MRSGRTLIVLGSSLTALAVVRAAHRRGLHCIMLDDTVGPGASTRLAAFRRVTSVEHITQSCDDLAGRDDVAVIADSDRWLRIVRDRRELFVDNRWQVLHPQAHALDICLDKSAFLRWCAQHDLPAPRLFEAVALEHHDASAYPLMLRPNWTQHSKPTGLPKALQISEPAIMQHWLARYAAAGVTPNISQSLLCEGLRQFSVGAARNQAGVVRTFLAEKIRPHADQCSGGTFVVPAVQPGIEALAATTLQTLDFYGVAEVEILYNPKTQCAYLVEINARPWLQYGLAYACGHDLIAHVLGEDTSVRHASGRQHAWLYFSSDLYACFAGDDGLVSTGKLSRRRYLRTLLSADIYAYWDARDPMPWLHSVVKTVKAAWQRLIRSNNRSQLASH